ncbi:DUF551 domain-containing protein [Escherichia coli]|uniref:DUF551 domain-containing protein n=1 Tax=Escherichia coli TaxID=562 RepID=UPI0039F73CFB
MTTITKERLLTIKQWRETYGPGSNVVLPAEEAEELARIALASLEAEPIAMVVPDEMDLLTCHLDGVTKTYADGWNACRVAMLQAGNFRENKNSSTNNFREISETSTRSPITLDGWISCTERMPDTKTAVLVAVEFDRKGDWRMKWATYIPGHPDANDGWIIPGASWKPSHWMPLPEPPQEAK